MFIKISYGTPCHSTKHYLLASLMETSDISGVVGLLLEVHVDVLYIYFKDESLGIIGGFTVNNLRLYICILVISVVWTGQDFFFQSLVFMLQLM